MMQIYFRAPEDHVVDDASQPVIISGVSSSEVTERSLLDSYHVATLDNDAEMIFEESAEFIQKVTA
jgi:carboxylesterase